MTVLKRFTKLKEIYLLVLYHARKEDNDKYNMINVKNGIIVVDATMIFLKIKDNWINKFKEVLLIEYGIRYIFKRTLTRESIYFRMYKNKKNTAKRNLKLRYDKRLVVNYSNRLWDKAQH